MTTLADDLLRSRTIGELRDLVSSLENDSQSRKIELQLMVGSKYHDFIQSADKITVMKEKSLMIQKLITTYSSQNQALVETAQTLLRQTILPEEGGGPQQQQQQQTKKGIDSRNALSISKANNLEDITSARLWNALNDCNVYEAAKLVLSVNIMLLSTGDVADISSPNGKLTNSLPATTTTTTMGEYFSSDAKLQLQLFHASVLTQAIGGGGGGGGVGGGNGSGRKHQLSDVLFLSSTVLEDARLMLMVSPDAAEDATTTLTLTASAGINSKGLQLNKEEVIDKAKALAALSLLSSSSSSSSSSSASWLTTQQLLQEYLASAEARLQSALLPVRTATDGANSNKSNNNDDNNSDGNDSNNSTSNASNGSIAEGITAVVRLLQHIVVDVQLLFLSPIPTTSHNSTTTGTAIATATTTSSSSTGGLVTYFQSALLADIVAQVSHCVAESSTASTIKTTTTANESKKNPCELLGFDMRKAMLAATGATSATTATTAAALRERRKCFQTWLQRVLVLVTASVKAALATLTSAPEVAQLQQLVWHRCVYISDDGSNISNDTAETSDSNNTTTTNNSSSSSSSARARLRSTSGSASSPRDQPNSSSSFSSSSSSYAPALKRMEGEENGIDTFAACYQYTYSQPHWEAASAALLSTTSITTSNATVSGGDQSSINSRTSTATTASAFFLWSSVFRPCFLHQVERLLKRSCDDVLARTQTHLLRALFYQGVQLHPQSLAVLSPSPPATSTSSSSGISDYTSDVSQISSPKLYQFAEKIRQQFETDISLLLASVVEPIQASTTAPANTTAPSTGGGGGGGGGEATAGVNASTGGGDSGLRAQPSAAADGALGKALHTQCSVLIGHTLRLLRAMAESLVRALAQRGCTITGSDALYACLTTPSLPSNGSSSSGGGGGNSLQQQQFGCALNPAVQSIVRQFCGVSTSILPSASASASTSTSTSTSRQPLTIEDQCLLSGLLFIGRIAWLFKTRGSFLEFALTNSISRNSDANRNSSTSNNISTSTSNAAASILIDEDQFRSAFEIADTNGNGMLTYHEALEALQALSGASNVGSSTPATPATPDTPSSASSATAAASAMGDAYGLSAAFTPTLSYAEFALICGASLLREEEFNPLSRLSHCVGRLLTYTHVTWAVCTVNMLGRRLPSQLLQDYGVSSAGGSRSGTNGEEMEEEEMEEEMQAAKQSGQKFPKKKEVQRIKPFKVSWQSGSMNLHSQQPGPGGEMEEEEEVVAIPAGMCLCLRSFLHRINQHGTAALVSLDTMQPVALSNSSVSAAAAEQNGGERDSNNSKGHSNHSYNNRNNIDYADLLESPATASSQAIQNVLTDTEADIASSIDTVLSILSGGSDNYSNTVSSSSSPPNIILAHWVNRLLVQLSLAYVHFCSNQVFQQVLLCSNSNSSNNNNNTAASSSLAVAVGDSMSMQQREEVALQCVFDLTVCSALASQWSINDWSFPQQQQQHHHSRSSSSYSRHHQSQQQQQYGLRSLCMVWQELVDPISAELVLPLVLTAAATHTQTIALLLPYTGRTTTAAAAAAASTASTSKKPTQSSLLSGVFTSETHATSRFQLLPLAISTAPPTSSSSSSSSSVHKHDQSNGKADSGDMSGKNKQNNDGSGILGTKTSKTTSSSSSGGGGVLNWWG